MRFRKSARIGGSEVWSRFGDRGGEGAGNVCVMTGALAFRGGVVVVVVVEEGILHRPGYFITMRKKAE